MRVTNNIIYDADVYYWNKVARQEMVTVTKEFKESVATLVEVVKDREKKNIPTVTIYLWQKLN